MSKYSEKTLSSVITDYENEVHKLKEKNKNLRTENENIIRKNQRNNGEISNLRAQRSMDKQEIIELKIENERLLAGLKDIDDRFNGKGNRKWIHDHVKNLLAGREHWKWEGEE